MTHYFLLLFHYFSCNEAKEVLDGFCHIYLFLLHGLWCSHVVEQSAPVTDDLQFGRLTKHSKRWRRSGVQLRVLHCELRSVAEQLCELLRLPSERLQLEKAVFRAHQEQTL